MNNRILEQLYLGNLAPVDSVKPDAEYRKLQEQVCTCGETLQRLLTEQQQQALETFLDTRDSLSFHDCVHAFSSGFSLGVQLLLATLD